MPSIDVNGAAARLAAFKTNTPAQCLNYVWQAIAQGRYHYITGGAANAYATWQAIPANKRHNGDVNAPRDFPMFFGVRTSTGNILGDVVLSDGTPFTIATDYPTSGRIGRPTLAQRKAQVGRVYLGWAESMGGYDLHSSSLAGGGATPIIPKPIKHFERETDMLIMNRTQDNVIAVFGEDELGPYWQEIHYLASAPSGTPLEVTTRYVIGLAHSYPVVDYDDTGWNYRSNKNPTMKRDVFDVDPKTGIVTWKAKPATGGSTGGTTTGPLALSDADIAKVAAAVLANSDKVATVILDAQAARLKS